MSPSCGLSHSVIEKLGVDKPFCGSRVSSRRCVSPGVAKSQLIRDEEVSWGRTNGTYTFPDDANMSRSHAKVYHRGEDFLLEDAGSRNGTFVKVRERMSIRMGETLLLGTQLLRVTK